MKYKNPTLHRINPATHLLEDVTFHPSPNCDERPDGEIIHLLVIHGISLPPQQFSGDAVDTFFMNRLAKHAHPYFQTIADLKVSAHLFIRRDGNMIQYVPFNKRAWHAGKSRFQGKKNCNDFSIGIELEGADDIPYTMPQYQVLADVSKVLLQCYPIVPEHIVGHSDIAPQRKTDPGPAFDWQYYFKLLKDARMQGC